MKPAELLIRALALGVCVAGAAIAASVLRTPELAASPWAAFLWAGPILMLYAVLGLGLAAGLVLLALGARAAGLDPRRVTAPRVLWVLVLTALALTLFNQALRSGSALEPWKELGRAAVLLPGLLLLGTRVVGRPRPAHPRTLRLERGLALLLVPGGLALALYVTRELPPVLRARPGDVLALAPRFEPEPAPLRTAARAHTRSRVILLGIDGADWDDIGRGVAEGRLPHFRRLLAQGVTAPLATLVPTYSPRIWTTLVTGVPPEAHGVTDFYLTQLPRLGVEDLGLPRGFPLLRELFEAAGELRRVPATSSLRRRKAIWNLADEVGLRSAVLGLWATWPPEPLEHGFVVSDHASAARRHEWTDRAKTSRPDLGTTTHPPELEARLARFQRASDTVTRQELATFLPVDDALWREFQALRAFSKGVPLSAFRSTFLNDAFYLDAALHLWREEALDLMVVYARALDELSHFFYEAGVPEAEALGWTPGEVARYGDVVERAYTWMDARLAPFLEAAERDPSTLLVVVSDHGWEKEPDGGYDHNHAPPGILALYGAGVCRRDCPGLEDADVYDVAPTLLARLGLPLSRELPGRPLVEAFQEPRPRLAVPRYGEALGSRRAVASELDPALNQMLEALGYVR